MANDHTYITVDPAARGLTVSLAPSSLDLPVVGGARPLRVVSRGAGRV